MKLICIFSVDGAFSSIPLSFQTLVKKLDDDAPHSELQPNITTAKSEKNSKLRRSEDKIICRVKSERM